MNNIVLICDEKTVLETLKSNLLFLRKFDSVFTCDYVSSDSYVYQSGLSLVIIYSKLGETKSLNFVKKFRTQSSVPVLYVTDEINEENLLSMFEAGVNDYLTVSQSQTEFLVRVMFCLKKGVDSKKYWRSADLLAQIGIVNKNTDFYSKKYSHAVFKTFVEKYNSNKVPAVMMAIAPDTEMKNRCSLDFLASILKQNLRDDDEIGFSADSIYVLLPNTNVQGALDVYNKIKKIMKDSCTISAGIMKLSPDVKFLQFIKSVDAALTDALLLKNNAVVQESIADYNASNWLDKSNKKHKSFKLFKKSFMKKLETVIAPVFYQKQQIAEQRLFQAEIEQYTNEKNSRFTIKKGNIHSIFDITYPGAVKINIDIFKNINDDVAPIRKSYDLNDLTEKTLSNLLDKFIRDFQKSDKQ